jgi:hypothetical protein
MTTVYEGFEDDAYSDTSTIVADDEINISRSIIIAYIMRRWFLKIKNRLY